jgi:hypothetical protein
MADRRVVAVGVLAGVVALGGVIADAQAPAAAGQGAPAAGQGQGAPAGQGAPPAGAGRGGPGGAGAPAGRGGAGGGRGRGTAFTPTPGAKDMKSVLYNWTWSMGMLRSGAESELIKTLHYVGAGGTIQVNGQPCTLTKYQMNANYQLPGFRVQIACTRANKQTYSVVENLSGDYSWDDDIPGAELVEGKGKSTPRPEAYEERWIRLWASPHGAPKAAIAAAAGLPTAESFGQNPATLLDRQAAANAKSLATLEWLPAEKPGLAERAVITFPIPGMAGAMAKATLDGKTYLPSSVVVTHGSNTTEFVYSNWADWNNPLFKIEALYAGTMVERKNGAVLRTVRAKVTEIGQIYVQVPVPSSVEKAGPAKK